MDFPPEEVKERLLNFGPNELPQSEWLLVVGLACTVVPVIDIAKLLIRRLIPMKQVADF